MSGTTKAAKYISASFPRQIARKSLLSRIQAHQARKAWRLRGQNQRRQPHLLSFAESPSAFFRLSLFSRRSSFAGCAFGRPVFWRFLNVFSGLSPVPFRRSGDRAFAGQNQRNTCPFFPAENAFQAWPCRLFQAERARPAPISDLAGFCPIRHWAFASSSNQSYARSSSRISPSRGMEASSTKMPKSVTPLTEASKDFSFMPLKQQAAHAARHFPFTFHGLCAREH